MYWYQSLPMSSKFHWTVGPVHLKLLPDQINFHQPVGAWSIAAFFIVITKTDQNKKTDQTTDRRDDVHIWIFCRMYLCFNGHIRSVQRYWQRLMYQYTPLTLRGHVVLGNTDVYIFTLLELIPIMF